MYQTCGHFLESFEHTTIDTTQPLVIQIESCKDHELLITELEGRKLVQETVNEFAQSLKEKAYRSSDKTVERLCYRLEIALTRLEKKKPVFIPLYYPLDTMLFARIPESFGVYLWRSQRLHLHFYYRKTDYENLLSTLFFYASVVTLFAKKLRLTPGIIRGQFQHFESGTRDNILRERIVAKYGFNE